MLYYHPKNGEKNCYLQPPKFKSHPSWSRSSVWHLKVHTLSGSSHCASFPSLVVMGFSWWRNSPPGLFPHRRGASLDFLCVFVWVEFTSQKSLFFFFGFVRDHLDLLVSWGITDKLTLVTSYDRLSPGTQGQKAFTLQNCGEPCGRPGALAKPTERDTIFGQNFAACRAWKIKSAVAWLKLSSCNLQRTNSKIFQVHKLSKSQSSMIQWIHSPTVVNHIFY